VAIKNKLFFGLFSALLVTFLFLIFQREDNSDLKRIKEITQITQLPGLSISTTPFENRILGYKDSSNRFYLNTDSYGYMEFVYAK